MILKRPGDSAGHGVAPWLRLMARTPVTACENYAYQEDRVVIKIAQIGRIDNAGRMSQPLRKDPQEGVNVMPFQHTSATCREQQGVRVARGVRYISAGPS